MKRTFAFILAIIFTALPLASCKGGGTGSGQLLSFSQAQSIEEMEKLDGKEVNRVYLAPQETEIPFTVEDGYVGFKVDKLECHQMVVVEYK